MKCRRKRAAYRGTGSSGCGNLSSSHGPCSLDETDDEILTAAAVSKQSKAAQRRELGEARHGIAQPGRPLPQLLLLVQHALLAENPCGMRDKDCFAFE